MGFPDRKPFEIENQLLVDQVSTNFFCEGPNHAYFVCLRANRQKSSVLCIYLCNDRESVFHNFFFIKEIQSIIIESISLQRRSTNEKNGIFWGGVIVFCLIDIQSQPSLLSN